MFYKGLAAAALVAITPFSHALSVNFDLSDWNSADNQYGAYADAYHYEEGGINLTVTGHSFDYNGNVRDGRVGSFQNYYNDYFYGIGIKNSRTDNSHTVDNYGWDDFLMFDFDTDVALSSFSLGWISKDSDITTAYLDDDGNIVHVEDVYNAEYANNYVNDDKITSNVWFIASVSSFLGGTANDWKWDGVKIDEITVHAAEVPLPASLLFMLTGLAGLYRFKKKKA